MNLEKFKKNLIKYAMNLEIVIAVCISISILLGIFTLARYLMVIAKTDAYALYDTFKKFLSIALLLVIGVEMVLMLLSHSSSSILELVLFAIARKMLIYSETMLDLILGTVAIAIVFIIRKYLMSSKYTKYQSDEGNIVSAASPIHDLNFYSNMHIPENKGVTVGGLICHLSEETGVPIEVGAEYSIENVCMKIIKMKDGLIEKVVLRERSSENIEVESKEKVHATSQH
ncbi:transporter associated domain-containing protein [Alkaliphilus transvaalensis]|uniref:transporter associated domain-containing protein n=1 Tax=Alkaliphilus transvaalensis TaxID=114628 RepID=UPI000A06DD3B|nr:transporter associated domain-containing protein [Alkaliphilus transvaalensis]